MPRRHRKMTGGFWESLTQSVGDAWNKTKKATTDAYSSASSSMSSPTPTPISTPYTSPTTPTPVTSPTATSTGYMGGRKKRKTRKTRKHMRGGYSDNTPLTGLAASAESVSDIKSAEPHTIVGGKRRSKKHRRHSKTRKH